MIFRARRARNSTAGTRSLSIDASTPTSYAPSHASRIMSVAMSVSTPFSIVEAMVFPQPPCGQIVIGWWHAGHFKAERGLRSRQCTETPGWRSSHVVAQFLNFLPSAVAGLKEV